MTMRKINADVESAHPVTRFDVTDEYGDEGSLSIVHGTGQFVISSGENVGVILSYDEVKTILRDYLEILKEMELE